MPSSDLGYFLCVLLRVRPGRPSSKRFVHNRLKDDGLARNPGALAISQNCEIVVPMKVRSSAREIARRAEVFKALGHPDRLRIVDDLAQGERCVCELVEAVGSSWSTVSRHLSVLRSAGVVKDEKRGLQVFYRIALPCVPSFMDCLDAAHRGEAVEMRRCCTRERASNGARLS
jgi:DNA-binding transcriptional ArsR family regulator